MYEGYRFGHVSIKEELDFLVKNTKKKTIKKEEEQLTTVCVLSMSAVTVLFKCLSLAGASVKRKISESNGAIVKAS